MTHAQIRHHRRMTDLRAEALAYLDQARQALLDPGQDPRAAALSARQAVRTADLALATLMAGGTEASAPPSPAPSAP